MFNFKKLFTKSAFVGLAITLSLGLQMSRGMEQDPNQNNLKPTTSKNVTEFQVDKILSDTEQFTNQMRFDHIGLKTRQIAALRDEKDILELTYFFTTMPGFDLNQILADVEKEPNPMTLQNYGLRGCKAMALREEKELMGLTSFFNTFAGFDLDQFSAELLQTADLQVWGARTQLVKALREKKEFIELTSFFIIKELETQFIPIIMMLDHFLTQQRVSCDIINPIMQNLFFLSVGDRLICLPKK